MMGKKYRVEIKATVVDVADDGTETVWANDDYVARNLDYGAMVMVECGYIKAKTALLNHLAEAGLRRAVDGGCITEGEAAAIRDD